jgi:hypothetical protein
MPPPLVGSVVTTAVIVSYTRGAGYVVRPAGPRFVAGRALVAKVAPGARGFQSAPGSQVAIRVSTFEPFPAVILGPPGTSG